MNRFFSALPTGKIVKRSNWTISTTGELFCLAGTHMSVTTNLSNADSNSNPSNNNDNYDFKQEQEKEEIDIDKTVLRCERQTLHRLPETRALVFGFVSSLSSPTLSRI
jgi:hypothetical protein